MNTTSPAKKIVIQLLRQAVTATLLASTIAAQDSSGTNNAYIVKLDISASQFTPTPGDDGTDVPVSMQLTWSNTGGAVTSNDVYFGKTNPPPFLANTTAVSFNLNGLEYGTRYYWKIVSHRTNGSVESPVWSFTTATAAGPALQFIPMVPCRLVDTRFGTGPFAGPPLAGGATRDFVIPDSGCGVPANAQAYSLNVAVVPDGKVGYLTMWSAGQPRPPVSTLNSDGRVKSNAAIVPAGNNGTISVFVTDPTHLILDINGYFVPASTPNSLRFYPVPPCRVVDTRAGAGFTGALGAPSLAATVSRTFPILSSNCNLPHTVAAYSFNLTVIPKAKLYLTAWPTGSPQPVAASLNAALLIPTANAAIVPAGTNGSVDIFTNNDADLVIDVTGYFAPPGAGGLSLYNVPPCRALDTRMPPISTPVNGSIDVGVTASGCGTPPSARAYVLGATVVPPGPLLYLTLWPQARAQPLASTLNAKDGAITGNMALVPTDNGSITAFASQPTHLILDVFGYFGP